MMAFSAGSDAGAGDDAESRAVELAGEQRGDPMPV
jgi:hypothetical protein